MSLQEQRIGELPLITEIGRFLREYPTPSSISYFWNFGILSFICLLVQIVTGIALAMHYVPEVQLAFDSVEHIMRDVSFGWLLRYTHANGASLFFIVVYIHLFRGLFYSSFVFPRQEVWLVGVIILFLMIVIAFMGYVLPWGQMSFWGATVITNLVSAVPFIGSDIVIWLWGGYAVGNATLNRFFSLHFVLPFVLFLFVIIHFYFLHQVGSGNPTGLLILWDHLRMYPYHIVKDLYGAVVFLIFFAYLVFFNPNLLGHPDNWIQANPIVTPPHIVPEWYFLPFYAILRSIPDKLFGVLALLASILVLAFFPFLNNPSFRSFHFRPLSKILFSFFVLFAFMLGWIGAKPIEYPFLFLGQLLSFLYFYLVLEGYSLIVSLENIFFLPLITLGKFVVNYENAFR